MVFSPHELELTHALLSKFGISSESEHEEHLLSTIEYFDPSHCLQTPFTSSYPAVHSQNSSSLT